ncbi:HrpA-like RNA helicase [Fadolivirus algeromassiliense]|jgi:pre-mRNA-splicing factor ATP-dependent RNA helicase DHX15/PRP43|uniref:HrpA-like RNA helicase n=1 Tax=Fadolivirus FV1/VV64 TaxID=3070911 RepID=A0A7D3UTV9_9VIRU|nr:HrpA-like RNA helicase [Fadolivirus algeromassiliense]QKF93711.1 HrpA-like RNA helicase [Fadolivirus FV1/VV64]
MDNIGILDPEGINNNPLTGKPYSERYKELAKKWSGYPVYGKSREIIKDIQDNQVILLISTTGSGKSVLVPKLALHTYNYNAKIAMTLPKQIITKSAAEFAALTLDVELGQEVGYQYRGSDPNHRSNKTKILYCTDGTIVAMLLNDPYLKTYDCILVDEAHERKTQIDFLIYLLRETVRLRPEFKVIFMSATINTAIFENYFRDFKFKVIDVGGARTYPITSHFLDKSLEYKESIDESFNRLIKILETDNPKNSGAHDILLFVTSSNEAFTICKKLNDYVSKEKQGQCKITCDGDIFCVEVFAGMDEKRQSLAQDKELYKLNTKYNRKVVIATNVAESSLTIDGIKYVIDTGYELSGTFDPENRARKLDRGLITQAQAKQRMGRGGRTEPGVCYHLYRKEDFDNVMEKFPQPDIRTSDITSECLKLMGNDKINTIEKLVDTLSNFIEPPRENFIRVAINNLIQLGAIEKGILTPFGKLLIDIPENNIFMATSLIFGKMYNCSREIMKIVSLMDACKGKIGDLYNLPEQKTKKTDQSDEQFKSMVRNLEEKLNNKKKKFANKYGDHLSLLNLYMKFNELYKKNKEKQDKLNDWCYDHFLKLNPLLKAIKHYKKIKPQLNNLIKGKLDPQTIGLQYSDEINNLELNDKVLACLLLGYRLNTASKKSGTENYRTQFNKDGNIKINKHSFLTLKSTLPSNVFYNELFISMGRSELVLVSEIPKSIMKILA